MSITTGIAHSKLNFVIYNSGSKPVFLHDAGFQLGRFRRTQDDSIESILAGRGLPKVLKPGEEFVSNYALSDYKSYLPDRLFEIWQKRSRLNRAVFFVAVTGTRHCIRYPMPSRLVSYLVRKGT